MRALRISVVVFLAALLSVFTLTSNNFELGLATRAHAQAVPKSIQEGGAEYNLKMRRNNWTVGIAGGQLSGTYMTFANELAEVLDDGDNLRVLPIVSYGAASNLDDLLYLRGVDVAVTQSDVFEYFQTQRKVAGLQSRVHYITRLPVSEVHIMAKRNIRSIEDLRGKKVNFGPAGSGSSLTGPIIFQRAGVKVEQTQFDNPVALQKLRIGRDRRSDPHGQQADRFLRQDPGEGRFPPGADPVHSDVLRLLHARRVHQGRISDLDLRRRYHHGPRRSGGARGVQLAGYRAIVRAG